MSRTKKWRRVVCGALSGLVNVYSNNCAREILDTSTSNGSCLRYPQHFFLPWLLNSGNIICLSSNSLFKQFFLSAPHFGRFNSTLASKAPGRSLINDCTRGWCVTWTILSRVFLLYKERSLNGMMSCISFMITLCRRLVSAESNVPINIASLVGMLSNKPGEHVFFKLLIKTSSRPAFFSYIRYASICSIYV